MHAKREDFPEETPAQPRSIAMLEMRTRGEQQIAIKINADSYDSKLITIHVLLYLCILGVMTGLSSRLLPGIYESLPGPVKCKNAEAPT